jgi:hypothetical protein
MANEKDIMMLRTLVCSGTLMAALAATVPAEAQVPPAIYAEMVRIGQIVDPACTAKLYRPMMPANDINSTANPIYPGVTITRDMSFGSNPKDVVDIFVGRSGGSSRPVVIFVPGGGGNKIEQQTREANAFYDNIGRWATKQGMVGVLMQRHPGPDWDSGGRDVGTMIQWLQENVKKHNGNPDRMFIWAQSAGNGPLGTYIGRPELHGPKGVGVKGAVFMSGAFNIAPLQPPPDTGPGAFTFGAPGANPFASAGTTCGAGGPGAGDGAIAGPSGMTPEDAQAFPGGRPGGPGGPGAPGGAGRPGGLGAGRGGRGAVDPEVQLMRSSLPGFRQTKVALFFVSAELDPGISGKMANFYQVLHDDLCGISTAQCPTMLFAKGHNHMSEVFSIDTPDRSVSGPILNWMKKIK